MKPNAGQPKDPESKPANAKFRNIASASIPDTLAELHVNPDTGLAHTDVDTRRKERRAAGVV